MARLAYLLAATLAAAFLASACEKNNPAYCDDPTHSASFCIDGMPQPIGCKSNDDCATGANKVCDLAGDKTCVQCTGTGQVAACTDPAAPTCDNRACRACKAHTDCDSLACLPNGTCAPEGTVAYVADSNSTDNTMCTKAMPCTKIQKAIDTGRAVVKLHGNLDEGVNVDRSLTVLADPATKLTRGSSGPILQFNNTITVDVNDLAIDRSQNPGDPAIQANSNTTVTLNRVTVSNAKNNGITCLGKAMSINGSTIRDNGQIGVQCNNGTLSVSTTTVRNSGQLGVSTNNCALTMSASMIRDNTGGGIQVMNATFDVINSFLVHNGATNSTVGGAALGAPSLIGNRFEFNTVADNHLKESTLISAGVVCDTLGVMLPNNIIAHNDINGDVTRGNANTIGACTYPSSAVGTPLADLKFANSTTGSYDYRLTAGSVAIGAASTLSTIAVDFEGDPRPATGKDQGADEYKP